MFNRRTVQGMIKRAKKDFYSTAIKYHTNRDLRHLFGLFLPDREDEDGMDWRLGGIDLATIENPFLKKDEEDKKNHPIKKYTLVYCNRGFVMLEGWKGDLLWHCTSLVYKIKGGKLIYKTKERGEWAMLETFPDLTTGYLDERVKNALDEINTKVKGDIRELERKLTEKQKDLTLVQMTQI